MNLQRSVFLAITCTATFARADLATYLAKPEPEGKWSVVSKTEARVIAEDAARRIVDRVAHSMNLEAQRVPQVDVDEMVREATATLVADLG